RAVDGDERQVAQVDAALPLRRPDLARIGARPPQHGLGPQVRNRVGMDGDVGGHALLVGGADDTHDPPDRLLHFRGIVEDARDHDLPRLRFPRLPFRDQDPVRDLRVVGHDDADAALAHEAAGDLLQAALQDLDHARFRLAAMAAPDDLDRDAIAVEQRAHTPFGEPRILAAVVAQHVAVTVGVADDRAGDRLDLLEQAVLAAAVLDDLPRAHHPGERVRERLARAPGADAEGFG